MYVCFGWMEFYVKQIENNWKKLQHTTASDIVDICSSHEVKETEKITKRDSTNK